MATEVREGLSEEVTFEQKPRGRKARPRWGKENCRLREEQLQRHGGHKTTWNLGTADPFILLELMIGSRKWDGKESSRPGK